MGFGGHALDMIQRMQRNRDKIKSRRERTNKVKNAQYEDVKWNKILSENKAKVSKKQTKSVIEKIREEKKLERRTFRDRMIVVLIVAFVSLILIISMFS